MGQNWGEDFQNLKKTLATVSGSYLRESDKKYECVSFGKSTISGIFGTSLGSK